MSDSPQPSAVSLKRTRAHPDGNRTCTRHILPPNEPTIRTLAAQNGCQNSDVLFKLCAGLPQAVHSVFDLEYTDVLGLIPSADRRYAVHPSMAGTVAAAEAHDANGRLLGSVMLAATTPYLEDRATTIRCDDPMLLTWARQAALEALVPAFRLASAILTSEDQLPFWHGIQRAGKRAWKSGSSPDKIPSFVTKTDFTAENRSIALAFLQELGQGLFISFCDTESDCGTTQMPYNYDPQSDGARRWLSEPRLPHDQRPRFARIELSAHLYLLPLLRWRETTPTQLRRMYFGLAVTMLHELAHAAAGYAFRYSQNESALFGDICFRGDQIGWSYETYAFGGGVDIPSDGFNAASVFDWPCPQTILGYQKRGCCASRRGPSTIIGSSGNVSVGMIDRFFDCHFWNTPVCGDAQMPFRLRRCCGFKLYDKEGTLVVDDGEKRRLLKKRKMRL